MKDWRKCFNTTFFLTFLFTNSEIMSEKSNLRASALCQALGSCLLCLMGNPPLILAAGQCRKPTSHETNLIDN